MLIYIVHVVILMQTNHPIVPFPFNMHQYSSNFHDAVYVYERQVALSRILLFSLIQSFSASIQAGFFPEYPVQFPNKADQ